MSEGKIENEFNADGISEKMPIDDTATEYPDDTSELLTEANVPRTHSEDSDAISGDMISLIETEEDPSDGAPLLFSDTEPSYATDSESPEE